MGFRKQMTLVTLGLQWLAALRMAREEFRPTSCALHHGSVLPSLDWYRFAFDGDTAINCEFILCRVRKLVLFMVNFGVRDMLHFCFHVDSLPDLTSAYGPDTVAKQRHSLVRVS